MFFWLLDKADRRSSLVGGGVCDCYLLLFVVQQFNNCDRVLCVCHQKLETKFQQIKVFFDDLDGERSKNQSVKTVQRPVLAAADSQYFFVLSVSHIKTTIRLVQSIG